MIKIDFKDLKNGMKVRTFEGETGTVVDCDDIHNIQVQMHDKAYMGGVGLFCLDINCSENQYDPLYVC